MSLRMKNSLILVKNRLLYKYAKKSESPFDFYLELDK